MACKAAKTTARGYFPEMNRAGLLEPAGMLLGNGKSAAGKRVPARKVQGYRGHRIRMPFKRRQTAARGHIPQLQFTRGEQPFAIVADQELSAARERVAAVGAQANGVHRVRMILQRAQALAGSDVPKPDRPIRA